MNYYLYSILATIYFLIPKELAEQYMNYCEGVNCFGKPAIRVVNSDTLYYVSANSANVFPGIANWQSFPKDTLEPGDFLIDPQDTIINEQ